MLPSSVARSRMFSLPVFSLLVVLAITLALPRATGAYARWVARRANRTGWGDPVPRARDAAELLGYHNAVRDRARDGIGTPLDVRTWDDLDLDAVFAHVDRASGAPGQQVLYDWLRTPAQSPAPLRTRERLIAALGDSEAARAAVRAACERLARRGAHALPLLIWGALPLRPWWASLLVLLPVGAAAAFAAAAVWPRLLVVALVLALAGMVVRAVVRPRVDELADATRHLRALCRGARRLAADLGPHPAFAAEVAALRACTPALRRLERASTWVAFDAGDDATVAVTGFVNVAFSLDVATLYACLSELARRRLALQIAFETLGALDAACAVASWRAGAGCWTRPVLYAGATAAARVAAVRHPLVPGALPNDYAPALPGTIITGANMAGKSTYVRAVGLAAVLAQTLHTVPADAYAAPFLTVRTSIGRADDVTRGTSYYRAEADAVLALMAAARDGAAAGDAHLFLLDELFRGTNAVERVAAGAAVLDDLATPRDGARHHVIAATHDGELVERLAVRYAPWHFREQVAGGGLTFDYVLRPGPATTRNAIALLAELGAPASVVARALETAAELDAARVADPRAA